jgi:hypothetical protein
MIDISRMEGFGVNVLVRKDGTCKTVMLATPNYCRGCYLWDISCWGVRADKCNADVEIIDPIIFEKIKAVVHEHIYG